MEDTYDTFSTERPQEKKSLINFKLFGQLESDQLTEQTIPGFNNHNEN